MALIREGVELGWPARSGGRDTVVGTADRSVVARPAALYATAPLVVRHRAFVPRDTERTDRQVLRLRRRLVRFGGHAGASRPTVSEHQLGPGRRPRIAYLSLLDGRVRRADVPNGRVRDRGRVGTPTVYDALAARAAPASSSGMATGSCVRAE